MELGIAGKVALVAAASLGLGKAAAWRLAREGARVAICARRQDALVRAAAEISGETGSPVLPVVCDLTRAADIERYVDIAAEQLGPPEILVTNCGGPSAGPPISFSDSDWQHAFDQVFLSTVRLLRASLPHMQAKGWGRIVCITSTIKEVGNTRAKYGFDYETCAVISAIHEQSPDIKIGVDPGGAGDQGLMFGYACRETPVLMPLPIMLGHKLTRQLSSVRREGVIDYLRPDGKSQVTVEYEGDRPLRVEAVIVSAQHSSMVPIETVREDIRREGVSRRSSRPSSSTRRPSTSSTPPGAS